jgi:hypothetical protein
MKTALSTLLALSFTLTLVALPTSSAHAGPASIGKLTCGVIYDGGELLLKLSEREMAKKKGVKRWLSKKNADLKFSAYYYSTQNVQLKLIDRISGKVLLSTKTGLDSQNTVTMKLAMPFKGKDGSRNEEVRLTCTSAYL